ncbi:MAG: PASTA domain-containing protein [Spirochaetales bacterium]|nr:PASTA domain-containing protein [Spirochaetales bacterium]
MNSLGDIFSTIFSAIFITSDDSEEDKARKIIRYAFLGSIIMIGVVSWAIFVSATFGDRFVKVPNVQGDNIYTALQKISDRNLVADVDAKYSNDYPEGVVYFQNPTPNSVVKRGRVVNFNVSLGSTANALPDFRGMTVFELADFIDKKYSADDLKFNSIQTKYEYSDSVERGCIIRQTPAEGSPMKTVTSLEVVVSNGLESADKSEPLLADYTNVDFDKAVADLSQAGLLYNFTFRTGNYVRNNMKIASQSVPAGMPYRQIIEENKTISFVINLNEKFGVYPIEGMQTLSLPKKPLPYKVKVQVVDKTETSRVTVLDILTRGGSEIEVPYFNKANSKLSVSIEGQEDTEITL